MPAGSEFASKVVENSLFDQNFEKVRAEFNMDRTLLSSLPTEVKLELFALFQQGTQGNAEHVSYAPERQRDWAQQKQEAWESKHGLTFREAKQAYIDFVI